MTSYGEYVNYRQRLGGYVSGSSHPMIVFAESRNLDETLVWLAGCDPKKPVLVVKTKDCDIEIAEELPWDKNVSGDCVVKEVDRMRPVLLQDKPTGWMRMWALLKNAGGTQMKLSGSLAVGQIVSRKDKGFCVEAAKEELIYLNDLFGRVAGNIRAEIDGDHTYQPRRR